MTNNEIARRIRDRLDEIYARETVLGEGGQVIKCPSSGMPREACEFLADLIRSERPRATLETGMAYGRTTLFILQALLDNGEEFRPHVVMDPFQSAWFHNAARRLLRELAIENLVEFHEQRSEFVLPRLMLEGRQFDLAYIDADHRFDAVFVEFRFIHSLLKPGGLMVFDDTDWDAVHLTCRFAETNLGYQRVGGVGRPTIAPPEGGRNPLDPPRRTRLTAFRKPPVEPERAQFHLAPFFDGFPQYARTRGGELRHEGLDALARGDRALARRLFVLSLGYEPRHVKTYFRLLRTFLPLNVARMLSATKQGGGAKPGAPIPGAAAGRAAP